MDPRPRRQNRLTSVWLASQHRQREPARTTALIGGIASAAAAFTVLCMNAAAPTVQIHGALPDASPRRAYDILVRMPSRVVQQNGPGSLARPTDLAELAGGITLAQYNTIRRLAGVQVAAPMTMIGYVPLTVVIPVAVPASAIAGTPALFTVTDRQRADDGLTSVTEPDAGSTYVTASAACPAADQASSSPAAPAVAAPRLTTCWSTSTGPQPQAWAGRPPATVSVPVAWTFLLPLVAVDPAAEARLLHLDRALVQGSYLPSKATTPGQVPVIIASSVDDDQEDILSLARAPASAAGSPAVEEGPIAGQVIGTQTVTAAQAYSQLLSQLHAFGAAPVPTYWTPSPARYATAARGALRPLPVPADDGYRALSPHRVRSAAGTGGNGADSVSAAALRMIGEFDPAMIASSAATPSPYLGERLSGADARTQRLLDGGTLGPDGNPAGYPSPGATLVMPMQDIGAFAGSGYSGTDSRAPVGSIRIRVAGATSDNALSRERVRVVAQEIVRATGLHVQVTLAASADPRTIELPAGRDGLPALRLSEIWYRTDTSTTVSSAVDPRSVALSTLLLVIGAALAASGMTATLRIRRRELATLRALGWRRRQVAWQAGREFAVVAAAAGALAALSAYAFEAVLTRRPASGWPLLSIPAVVAMTLVAAWWQVRRATAEPARRPRSAESLPAVWQGRWPASRVAHLALTAQRAWLRAALGAFVLTIACAALGLELAVRWVFGGAIVGTWFGFVVSWQDDQVDLAAVITVLVLATIVIADIRWRNGTERTGELRTLRAIGWSARGLAALAVGGATLRGLACGVVASAIDAAGIAAVVHIAPSGLALVVLAVAVAGVVISVLAVGLSAAAERITTARATA
jgi:hypothetical protein